MKDTNILFGVNYILDVPTFCTTSFSSIPSSHVIPSLKLHVLQLYIMLQSFPLRLLCILQPSTFCSIAFLFLICLSFSFCSILFPPDFPELIHFLNCSILSSFSCLLHHLQFFKCSISFFSCNSTI